MRLWRVRGIGCRRGVSAADRLCVEEGRRIVGVLGRGKGSS